ncbi:MAG: stage III sporulation protein AA [Bacillota bacterium]
MAVVCPSILKELLMKMAPEQRNQVQELRLRQDRPLSILLGQRECFLTVKGEPTFDPLAGYYVTRADIERVFQSITRNSVYALEEELRNGYVTIAGGHRIGFTGEAVVVGGKVKNLKNITCLNIRIGREVKGCADKVLPWIINRQTNAVMHTLIISPPKCGKTTLLRDIIRQLSNGIPKLGFPGVNVGVVDERSELASCYMGLPQKEIGIRSDVLDKCPKAEGMYMLVRSMSPQVIATDEIGRREDVAAVQEVLNAGIKLITSVHGANLEDIKRRPVMKEIMAMQLFERLIVLGRSQGVGTLEEVIDGTTGKSLFQRR